MKDYQKSITVNNTTQEVYTALTQHIPDWWSDDFAGAAANKGDQYNIAFGETRKTFEIAEAIPGQQITWLCLKAYIDMDDLKKKDEWVGTRISWTIAATGNKTTLTMQHKGLNKGVECYDVCEPAWDYFMKSIELFLTTGQGTPYHKAKAKLEWEEIEQPGN
jgi:hypothetical protein